MTAPKRSTVSARYPRSETLLEQAVTSTGLTDFGPGDFRTGLDVLLDSLGRDGDLSPSTDAEVVGAFRRRLVNRLQVQAWYRDHPELADLSVRGPIDINGLPRTGTTALANMLSLDPQFRSLRGWEQSKPCPPPVFGHEFDDPRRQETVSMYEQMPAEMRSMHLYDVDASMEDTEVLGMAFHGQQMTLPVYGYQDWWRQTDLTATYEYHRRVITLLQSKRPPNLWLFKAPHHKFHLEAIASAYPEVRFVMTHRDPGKVVPSYASIVSAILPAADGERDLHRLGREISNHLRIGMHNAIEARGRIGEDRFLDVHHHELVVDPMGTLRRVYAWLGLELLPSTEKDIVDWRAKNDSGAHDAHHYTAEQFGLSAAQIRSDYDFYIQRFGVRVEQ